MLGTSVMLFFCRNFFLFFLLILTHLDASPRLPYNISLNSVMLDLAPHTKQTSVKDGAGGLYRQGCQLKNFFFFNDNLHFFFFFYWYIKSWVGSPVWLQFTLCCPHYSGPPNMPYLDDLDYAVPCCSPHCPGLPLLALLPQRSLLANQQYYRTGTSSIWLDGEGSIKHWEASYMVLPFHLDTRWCCSARPLPQASSSCPPFFQWGWFTKQSELNCFYGGPKYSYRLCGQAFLFEFLLTEQLATLSTASDGVLFPCCSAIHKLVFFLILGNGQHY